jgi:hypothetical protein
MKRKKSRARVLAVDEVAVKTEVVEQMVAALQTTLTAIETFGGYLLEHFDTMLSVAPKDAVLLGNRAEVVHTLAAFQTMRPAVAQIDASVQFAIAAQRSTVKSDERVM